MQNLSYPLATSQGHTFTYLKGEDEIREFQSLVDAKAAGFFKPLDIDQMIKITHSIIEKCKSQNEMDSTVKLLKNLAQIKVSLSPAEKTKSTSIFKSLFISSTPMISSERKTQLKSELKEVKGITASRDGLYKVYFLHTDKASSLVLKSASDPCSSIFADRFFSLFAFVTPKYELLTSSSKVFTTAAAQLQKFAQKSLKTPYMLVMNFLEGTTFTQLSMVDKVEAFNDPKVLRALGEMMFLDCIIGNEDRVSSGTYNPGNFMLMNDGVADKEGRPIALLDHDYCITEENFDRVVVSITELLAKQPFLKIVEGLLEDCPKDQIDKDKMFNEIWIGVMKAKSQFLKIFADKNMINKILDVPDELSPKRPDPSYFQKIYELVSLM